MRVRRGSGFVADGVTVALVPPVWVPQSVAVVNEGTVPATDFVDSDEGFTDFEVRRASGTDEDYAADITGTVGESNTTVDVLVRGLSPWPGRGYQVEETTLEFTAPA